MLVVLYLRLYWRVYNKYLLACRRNAPSHGRLCRRKTDEEAHKVLLGDAYLIAKSGEWLLPRAAHVKPFNIETIMKALNTGLRKKYSSAIRQGFINPDNPRMHDFCGAWTRKHPGRTTTLVRLKDILGHNPQWEDLTDDTLADLKEDMLTQMSPNSVRTICAELKAILNANRKSKPINSETFNVILRSKKVPTQNVYITPVELKHLHQYVPRNKREAYVKEIFMRECLTGARVIDCRRLTIANIHMQDNVEYITYVPQKHPVEVTVPVHKWLKNYLTEVGHKS